jgi:hypothetical protein
MTPIWTSPLVEWEDVEGNPSQMKVTTLHWRATLVDGEFVAVLFGTTPDDQNRVYTKPALENVPESTVIGWIQQALGQEEVDRIEQALVDDIAQQKTPTSGTITPGDG